MNQLITILVAIAILYLLFKVFMKVTQWIFRIIIIGVVVSLFVVGALNFDSLFSGSPQKIIEDIGNLQPENIVSNDSSVVQPLSVDIVLVDNTSTSNATETQPVMQEVNSTLPENMSA